MKGAECRGEVMPLGRIQAGHLMEKDIPYYHSDAIGLTLATAMINRSCGAIPIVDEQKQLIGIVTEFDLLNALMRGKDLETVRAAEIMALEPKFVRQETSAEEIIKMMDALHLIHLPVVNQEGQLIGLIERSDILLGYLESRLGPLQS
jgi:CBS domain-containing protein